MTPNTLIQESYNEIVSSLSSLKEDEALPKNIRAKLDMIQAVLAEDAELSSKVGRSLHILDEITEDLNIQPHIRTQVYGISTMLERLNH